MIFSLAITLRIFRGLSRAGYSCPQNWLSNWSELSRILLLRLPSRRDQRVTLELPETIAGFSSPTVWKNPDGLIPPPRLLPPFSLDSGRARSA
jgi:hypothetical protein